MPVTLDAVGGTGRTSRAILPIGQAARLKLLQTTDVRYPLRPAKPSVAASYGGMVEIDVQEAGTYRVALGSAAWIDLVHDRQAVTSSAHSHGPDCTGIRKIVDFPLAPGRYTLQVSANGEPQTTLLVAHRP
jgi:hypothetical protein